jgi:hypothetical protein
MYKSIAGPANLEKVIPAAFLACSPTSNPGAFSIVSLKTNIAFSKATARAASRVGRTSGICYNVFDTWLRAAKPIWVMGGLVGDPKFPM